jgi:hypothetical protein
LISHLPKNTLNAGVGIASSFGKMEDQSTCRDVKPHVVSVEDILHGGWPTVFFAILQWESSRASRTGNGGTLSVAEQ